MLWLFAKSVVLQISRWFCKENKIVVSLPNHRKCLSTLQKHMENIYFAKSLMILVSLQNLDISRSHLIMLIRFQLCLFNPNYYHLAHQRTLLLLTNGHRLLLHLPRGSTWECFTGNFFTAFHPQGSNDLFHFGCYDNFEHCLQYANQSRHNTKKSETFYKFIYMILLFNLLIYRGSWNVCGWWRQWSSHMPYWCSPKSVHWLIMSISQIGYKRNWNIVR